MIRQNPLRPAVSAQKPADHSLPTANTIPLNVHVNPVSSVRMASHLNGALHSGINMKPGGVLQRQIAVATDSGSRRRTDYSFSRMRSRAQPKFYPNLNPAAAISVDRSTILRLESFSSHYRLRRPDQHGALVPNSKYIFVKMINGEVRLHPQYRHPVLAEGNPVVYAGEVYFNNGSLEWWSNGSGNYRPDPDHAEQAEFPMEQFFTFEEILRGRQKDRLR